MFAVFFETSRTSEGHPQYIVFPTGKGDAVVFSRISNGGRTGHNRWTQGRDIPSAAPLTREPSTLVLTANDVEQFVSTGFPTTLTTKVLSAHLKAPETSLTTAALSGIEAEVAAADPALNRWVRDQRRARPVVPTTPTPKAAPVDVQPNPNTAPDREHIVVPVPVTPTASEGNIVSRMAVVPERSLADRYVHRTIAGTHDFAIFEEAQSTGHNVLLYGPTGPGKTTSAIAFAAEKGLPVFMISGTPSLEASQFFGRYVPDGAGGFVWQDGGITECVRHGGVLILDEINFIPSKIATVLFPLLASTRHITLLDHRGETIKAHPDLLIVGTMNPDYAGTLEMNAALRNRFKFQIRWGYDDNVEKTLVPSKVLREIANKLRVAEANQEILTPTPTNALIDFVDIATRLSLDFAISNFISRYAEDEQSVIQKLLDSYRANIEADLGVASLPTVEGDENPDDVLRDLVDLDLSL